MDEVRLVAEVARPEVFPAGRPTSVGRMLETQRGWLDQLSCQGSGRPSPTHGDVGTADSETSCGC